MCCCPQSGPVEMFSHWCYESRVCAPPDFRDLVEGYGVDFVAVGPVVRHVGSARSAAAGKPSPEAIRQLVAETIASQFATLGEAAAGFEVIVASTALQYAAHSIAEQKGIPFEPLLQAVRDGRLRPPMPQSSCRLPTMRRLRCLDSYRRKERPTSARCGISKRNTGTNSSLSLSTSSGQHSVWTR